MRAFFFSPLILIVVTLQVDIINALNIIWPAAIWKSVNKQSNRATCLMYEHVIGKWILSQPEMKRTCLDCNLNEWRKWVGKTRNARQQIMPQRNKCKVFAWAQRTTAKNIRSCTSSLLEKSRQKKGANAKWRLISKMIRKKKYLASITLSCKHWSSLLPYLQYPDTQHRYSRWQIAAQIGA